MIKDPFFTQLRAFMIKSLKEEKDREKAKRVPKFPFNNQQKG